MVLLTSNLPKTSAKLEFVESEYFLLHMRAAWNFENSSAFRQRVNRCVIEKYIINLATLYLQFVTSENQPDHMLRQQCKWSCRDEESLVLFTQLKVGLKYLTKIQNFISVIVHILKNFLHKIFGALVLDVPLRRGQQSAYLQIKSCQNIYKFYWKNLRLSEFEHNLVN